MECFALGMPVAVDRRVGGELGRGFSALSHVRISPPCAEVLELLGISDLGFDLVSLEFAAPCPRENDDGGRSRP